MTPALPLSPPAHDIITIRSPPRKRPSLAGFAHSSCVIVDWDPFDQTTLQIFALRGPSRIYQRENCEELILLHNECTQEYVK